MTGRRYTELWIQCDGLEDDGHGCFTQYPEHGIQERTGLPHLRWESHLHGWTTRRVEVHSSDRFHDFCPRHSYTAQGE